MTKNKRTEGKLNLDYGMKDYYKYFCKEHPEIKLTAGKYNNIITDINNGLIELIINHNIEYALPFFGSTLSVKKVKSIPRIKDGKLVNTSPVNWVATNKLWDKDVEAKENKLLVRFTNWHTSKYVFRIYFKKYVYPFLNKKIIKFKANRKFQRALSARINDDSKERYDAFILYTPNND